MCGYLRRKVRILRVDVTSHQQSAFTEFTCVHMYIHHEVLLDFPCRIESKGCRICFLER